MCHPQQDHPGGWEQAAAATLSVHAAAATGAELDVAVGAALRPPVDRVLKKAMAASALMLDVYRRPGAVGAVMIEGMSEVVGNHLGISVCLLERLSQETGRPARELLAEILADNGEQGS